MRTDDHPDRADGRNWNPWWRDLVALTAGSTAIGALLLVYALGYATGEWRDRVFLLLMSLLFFTLAGADLWVLLRRSPGAGARGLVWSCAVISGVWFAVDIYLRFRGLREVRSQVNGGYGLPWLIFSLATLAFWRRTDFPLNVRPSDS